MIRKKFVAVLIFMAFAVQAWAAEVPQTFTYSGRYVHADGSPMPDGVYDLLFALYETPTGGAPVWQELHRQADKNGVTVSKGNYTVVLGGTNGTNPLPKFDKSYYVAVSNPQTGQEVTARVTLNSAPYALGVNCAIALWNPGKNLLDFRLIYRDDFENNDMTGWTMKISGNAGMPACTKMGETTILGGYNVIANGQLYKEFDLTGIPHTQVMVKLDYWFVDSWDGERAYVDLGNIRVWHDTAAYYTDGSSEVGGNQTWTDRLATVIGRIAHSGNTVKVLAGSTLDDASANESFGIDNVEIWVR